MGKQNSPIESNTSHFAFFSLEKSKITEIWDLFHLWHYSSPRHRRLEEWVTKGRADLKSIFFLSLYSKRFERQQSSKLMILETFLRTVHCANYMV